MKDVDRIKLAAGGTAARRQNRRFVRNEQAGKHEVRRCRRTVVGRYDVRTDNRGMPHAEPNRSDGAR